MSVTSINLFSITDVKMETSGFGFDDSELTFTYINSPELKGHHVTYASHKLEFPKKYNVQSLYKILQELAYENCLRINGLDKCRKYAHNKSRPAATGTAFIYDTGENHMKFGCEK